jgi:hypothetical protein
MLVATAANEEFLRFSASCKGEFTRERIPASLKNVMFRRRDTCSLDALTNEAAEKGDAPVANVHTVTSPLLVCPPIREFSERQGKCAACLADHAVSIDNRSIQQAARLVAPSDRSAFAVSIAPKFFPCRG